MSSEISIKLVEITRNILSLLVSKDYEALENITKCNRLTAKDIQNCVKEYGKSIIEPPNEAYSKIDIVRIKGTMEYSVNMPLWTKEEGRSDLTILLSINLAKSYNTICIDDIHVL